MLILRCNSHQSLHRTVMSCNCKTQICIITETVQGRGSPLASNLYHFFLGGNGSPLSQQPEVLDINALARAPRDQKQVLTASAYILNNEICLFDPSGKPLSNHARVFKFCIQAELLYMTPDIKNYYSSFYSFSVIDGQKTHIV